MLRVFIVLALAATVCAQPAKVEKPLSIHGHDMKVRDVGKPNFDAMTPRVGIEIYHDSKNDALIAISETGHLAVTPYKKPTDDKKAEWLAAFELNVRPSTESSFTKAAKFGTEVYKDLATGKLLLVTTQRTLAWADAPGSAPSEKEPAHHHGIVLNVRAATDHTTTAKLGVEVYRDATTGQLVYLTEKGGLALAAAPTKAPEPQAPKGAKALHVLSLSSRKTGEGDFTDKTKAYGVDVAQDANSGAILYASETGSIAAIPDGPVKKGEGLKWKDGFTLKARKSGEKKLEGATGYSVEVFEDKNTGALIYICENGSIAALKK